MKLFLPVDCLHCAAPKIGEIASGLSRFRCRKCRHWTAAGRDVEGEVVRVQVDRPVVWQAQSS